MSKTTSPKPAPAPEAKRVSFFPLRPDMARLERFSNIFAERKGYQQKVHPPLREVFGFLLDCAEAGLPVLSGNGNGHSQPPPPDKRGKN